MAVLTGSCLSHVPDRAIVISSAPMISAQISKNMDSHCLALLHDLKCSRCTCSTVSRPPSVKHHGSPRSAASLRAAPLRTGCRHHNQQQSKPLDFSGRGKGKRRRRPACGLQRRARARRRVRVSTERPVRRTTMRYIHGRDSGSRARTPVSRRRRVPANASTAEQRHAVYAISTVVVLACVQIRERPTCIAMPDSAFVVHRCLTLSNEQFLQV